MPTPPTQHVRVIRAAREFVFPPRVWAEAFERVDWSSAERLSDKPGRSVWRVTLDLPGGAREIVVKVHTHRSVLDSVRSLFHLGRLRRQWRGAARLSRRGYRVARGLALLSGRGGGRGLDVLVMESVPGTSLLGVMARGGLSVREEHLLAGTLGGLVSLLDEERLHSKDLKPSNIIVDPVDPSLLTLIDSDTVGHRPAHPLLPLVIEAFGVGVLPRKALLARVVKSWAWREWLNRPFEIELDPDQRYERELARRAWKEIDELVARHGEAKPLHDPLGAWGPSPLEPAAR